MRRIAVRVVVACISAAACLVPVPAGAQERASIVGVVQDSSGAVLPGVTVEASSPVLIERVRAGITDGSGRYAIIDLRPGTYTISFSLPGFKSYKREGIVLEGDFRSLAASLAATHRKGRNRWQKIVTPSGLEPEISP